MQGRRSHRRLKLFTKVQFTQDESQNEQFLDIKKDYFEEVEDQSQASSESSQFQEKKFVKKKEKSKTNSKQVKTNSKQVKIKQQHSLKKNPEKKKNQSVKKNLQREDKSNRQYRQFVYKQGFNLNKKIKVEDQNLIKQEQKQTLDKECKQQKGIDRKIKNLEKQELNLDKPYIEPACLYNVVDYNFRITKQKQKKSQQLIYIMEPKYIQSDVKLTQRLELTSGQIAQSHEYFNQLLRFYQKRLDMLDVVGFFS